MDDLSIMPNRFVMTSRIVQVNVTEGPVGAWPSKLNIYVSRKETLDGLALASLENLFEILSTIIRLLKFPSPILELNCSTAGSHAVV